MTQKLYIQTNGCQMNEYDSDKMRDVLQASHGFELIDDPKLADVLLLNTCSIREKAQEKVFSALGKWRKISATLNDGSHPLTHMLLLRHREVITK